MTDQQAQIIAEGLRDMGREVRRGLVRSALIQKHGEGGIRTYKKPNTATIYQDSGMTKSFSSWDGYLDSGRIGEDVVVK